VSGNARLLHEDSLLTEEICLAEKRWRRSFCPVILAIVLARYQQENVGWPMRWAYDAIKKKKTRGRFGFMTSLMINICLMFFDMRQMVRISLLVFQIRIFKFRFRFGICIRLIALIYLYMVPHELMISRYVQQNAESHI